MWKREVRSFGYALKGIRAAFRTEPHLRFHAVAAVVVVACSTWAELSTEQWALVVLCIAVVFAAELVNTAVEKLVDLVSPQRNEQAGMIKDLAAGAVFIVSLAAAITGGLILVPRVIHKIIVMFG